MKKSAFYIYLTGVLVLIVGFFIIESGNNKAVFIPGEVSENLYGINESINLDKLEDITTEETQTEPLHQDQLIQETKAEATETEAANETGAEAETEIEIKNENAAETTLYIDGKEVVSVQNFWRMTDGERRFEYKSNILINELYQFLLNICGDCEETAAPDYYDEWIDYDVCNFYLMGAEISFMESEGSGGAVVRQFKTYYLTFPAEGFGDKIFHGTDLGMQLLCDVTNGIWYKVPGDDLAKRLSDIFDGDYEGYLIL